MLELNLLSPSIKTVTPVNTKALLRFDQAAGTATSTKDECDNIITPNGISIVTGKYGNGMLIDTGSNGGYRFAELSD